MEVELLEQIVKNTTHKTSFQIILSNDKSNFNTRFNPKLELDKKKSIRDCSCKPGNLLLISKY